MLLTLPSLSESSTLNRVERVLRTEKFQPLEADLEVEGPRVSRVVALA
jgi:hypothetical protein